MPIFVEERNITKGEIREGIIFFLLFCSLRFDLCLSFIKKRERNIIFTLRLSEKKKRWIMTRCLE
ncbi:hypothetical protein BCR43DRAFT_298531 [Syncephalastrum racemosum]|uniref:Uncharacterized protein n=1 Tax=Syncephalastrum racemosum TaxID=13706 RepID=A0A1X2H9N4_SYNRA|nr:hypothetical protein BCR43DRAFT_298531 [Syncephalastrum racemosum]